MNALPIHRIYRHFVLALVVVLVACQQPAAATPDPQIALRRQQERATLSAVTAVQKWQAMDSISQPENSAPSIVPLDNGDYRMYWNAPSLNGIGSATTPDGMRFNADEGARLINAPAGQKDCAIGRLSAAYCCYT